jgi:hypothetical protein
MFDLFEVIMIYLISGCYFIYGTLDDDTQLEDATPLACTVSVILWLPCLLAACMTIIIEDRKGRSG